MVCPMELSLYRWASFILQHDPNPAGKKVQSAAQTQVIRSNVECATVILSKIGLFIKMFSLYPINVLSEHRAIDYLRALL